MDKKKLIQSRPSGGAIYLWTPIPNQAKGVDNVNAYKKPYFCNAKKNSQGQDWITNYVYDTVIVNGEQQRSAYVECDYVE